jgi:hypothetical protein
MWRRAIHARNLLKEENPDAKFYMQSSAGDNAERGETGGWRLVKNFMAGGRRFH